MDNEDMLQEIYLVRHAAPDRASGITYNVEPGPPLTPTGRDEAQQAAAWLADRGLEYVFCSPFARTSQTADAIVDRLGLPISYVKALGEHGPGEAPQRVRERVAELIGQIDDGPLAIVAIVTHGMCVKSLLQQTTNDKIDLSKHVYDYGNCSPTAGIWHGVRSESSWRWELAFRPTGQ
ncbi:MAG: histidine phosphatase family protein [Roseiflexaceae bacterium]